MHRLSILLREELALRFVTRYQERLLAAHRAYQLWSMLVVLSGCRWHSNLVRAEVLEEDRRVAERVLLLLHHAAGVLPGLARRSLHHQVVLHLIVYDVRLRSWGAYDVGDISSCFAVINLARRILHLRLHVFLRFRG